jgi:lipoprotein-anchoring transpeptidase ErfK/SrfK
MTRITPETQRKLRKALVVLGAILLTATTGLTEPTIPAANMPQPTPAPSAQPTPASPAQPASAPEVVTPDKPAEDDVVREIIISIPDRKLALVEDDEIVKIYPVAVGRAYTPSPAGDFEIINRVVSPTYYHKHVVIPPGPDNPLGTRWIGLSRKGFGIHGTNEPWSIGRAASHGCIRMRQSDLEDLFSRVRPGDTVEIYDDATLAEIFSGNDNGDSDDDQQPATPALIASAQAQTQNGNQ